ncbi:hypothetical protein V1509DRAFT_641440 [Lipomyces kononenkoae]
MARRSKKSIMRSINGRKNAMKRFDIANRITERTEKDQSEKENAWKFLRFNPQAERNLKHKKRPGGSERSQRRFRAKFRNAEPLQPLTAFNFTNTATANGNLSEEGQRDTQQESQPLATEEEQEEQDEQEEVKNNAHGGTAPMSEECHESTGYAPENTVDLRALLERIEVRLQNQTNMPKDEVLQLTVLKHYFTDRLGGKGKMEASIAAASYSFGKGVYMARVIRDWARLYEDAECLPPPSKRGKHAKRTSALNDENVREQCMSYFRSPPPTARSATKLKAYYEQVVYPELTGSTNNARISLTTISRYLKLWGFTLQRPTEDVHYDDHERPDVVEYRQ